MEGKADFTGVVEQSGDFVLVPEGKYEAEIEQVTDGATQKGDVMITIALVITEGEYAGCRLWDRIVIPEPDSSAVGIRGRTMHFLHCIGEPYKNKFKWDSSRWVGKGVDIRVRHKEYQGKVMTEVAAYLGGEEGSSLPVEDDPV